MMGRFLLQGVLLAAVSGLGLSTLLRTPEPVGVARSASVGGSAPRWSVEAIEGRARFTRSVGGASVDGEARLGPVELPAVFEVEEGELRLSDGEVEIGADEGARVFLGAQGLRLDSGRLRVAGERELTVVAAGARIAGRRFGLWRTETALEVAALSPVVVNGQTVATGQGLRIGAQATPLAEVLELKPEPGLRPGVRQVEIPEHAFVFVQRDGLLIPRTPAGGRLVFIEGVTPFLRDALGRWAVPGRPSRSLEDLVGVFPGAADRSVLDRRRAMSEVESEATEPPPPEDEGARRRRRSRRTRDQSAPERPVAPPAAGQASEASKDGEGREPPDSLRVDWTQLGRPSGRVLEGSKKEAPAPGSESR